MKFSFAAVPYRWWMVGLLFLLTLLNSLDRQTLSVLAPTLRESLGFSAVECSYVVTSFLVAYGVGFFLCGAIIDRIGVKTAVGVALAGWSIATMLHAAAGGWFALGICRFLLGLGQSFSAPCGVKGVAEWIRRQESKNAGGSLHFRKRSKKAAAAKVHSSSSPKHGPDFHVAPPSFTVKQKKSVPRAPRAARQPWQANPIPRQNQSLLPPSRVVTEITGMRPTLS